MLTIRRLLGTCALATATAALGSGCGESGPKLVPVSGTVTYNGKPLADAEVTFTPDESNGTGRPGTDVTGPEGNFKIMTQGRAGAVPGKYKVTVNKTVIDMSKVPEAFKDDPYMARLGQEGAEVPASKRPPKIEGTFEREVPPEGGTIDIDVKGKAGAPGSTS